MVKRNWLLWWGISLTKWGWSKNRSRKGKKRWGPYIPRKTWLKSTQSTKYKSRDSTSFSAMTKARRYKIWRLTYERATSICSSTFANLTIWSTSTTILLDSRWESSNQDPWLPIYSQKRKTFSTTNRAFFHTRYPIFSSVTKFASNIFWRVYWNTRLTGRLTGIGIKSSNWYKSGLLWMTMNFCFLRVVVGNYW